MEITIMPVVWFLLAVICAFRACGDHIKDDQMSPCKVSIRHFRILAATGVGSWVLQVLLHTRLHTESGYYTSAIILTVLALVCFWAVTSWQFIKRYNISQRDLFQTLLWGQTVFPFTLLAIPGFTAIFGIS